MIDKLDLTKADPAYYMAKQQPAIVEFGRAPYLMLDGHGALAGAAFTQKTEALYQLAYGIKSVCKAQGSDFVVPKLEGLWWVEGERDAMNVPRDEWRWRLLIRMPDFVSQEIFATAQRATAASKHNERIHQIVFNHMAEGQCVQFLHVGPYATEPATVAKLLTFAQQHGLEPHGRHHEIYLSDPRKTAPERMKTLLRYPMRPC